MVLVANYKNRRPERQSPRPGVCCHLHCYTCIIIIIVIICMIMIIFIFIFVIIIHVQVYLITAKFVD